MAPQVASSEDSRLVFGFFDLERCVRDELGRELGDLNYPAILRLFPPDLNTIFLTLGREGGN